ncbi:MAG: LOG family protein [Methanocella sp.]
MHSSYFPGGFGTLDELFEILTVAQTGKASPLRIALFHKQHWRRIIDLEVMIGEGMIRR